MDTQSKYTLLSKHNTMIRVIFSVAVIVLVMIIIGSSLRVNVNFHDVWRDTKLFADKVFYSANWQMIDKKVPQDSVLSLLPMVKADIETPLPVGVQEAKAIPVLVYHRISDDGDHTSVTPEHFKEQMFMLKEKGYTTLSMDELYAYMQGKKKIGDKSIVVTFDDGAKDSYYPVDPILSTLGYRATMFIITGHSAVQGSTYYLTPEEVQEMIDSGRWDIQAHTHEGHDPIPIDAAGKTGYFFSSLQWLEKENRKETIPEYENRITYDLQKAKQELEGKFGVKNIGFAFPFGDFGVYKNAFPQAKTILLTKTREMYPLAFHQLWNSGDFAYSYNYPSTSSFLIKRIEVPSEWSGNDLLAFLQKGKPKNLPYHDGFESNKGWTATWGNVAVADKVLVLHADSKTTGAAVYLDGTGAWTGYEFNTVIQWIKGSTVNLLARYKDRNNFTSCNYSNGLATVKQRVLGIDQKLAESPFTVEDKQTMLLTMAVNGTTVSCLVNKKPVTSAQTLDASLSQGGIGFQVWDENQANAEMRVKYVEVK